MIKKVYIFLTLFPLLIFWLLSFNYALQYNKALVFYSFLEFSAISSFIFLITTYIRNIKFKILIFTILYSILFAIYTFQAVNILFSNNFLTNLAIANFNRIDIFLNAKNITFSTLVVLVLICIIYLFAKNKAEISKKHKVILLAIFVISASLTIILHKNLNKKIKTYNNFPIVDFIRELKKINTKYKPSKDFPAVYYFNKNSKFPFAKKNVFETPITNYNKNLNVIVIFIEGTYAKLLGSYGGKFENLTPNLDSLIERQNVMQVENYFNHTYATFAGISGSLGSFFPINDGVGGWFDKNESELPNKMRNTIPSILNSHQYKTYFISPHLENDRFTIFLKATGFNNIISSKTKPFGRDEETVSNLIKTLKEIEIKGENFFLSFYNMGTHAFVNTVKGETFYKDGKNSVLNRLHNFDLEFKKFLDFFFQSNLKENTILIITSDHTTYHEPPMMELYEDYNNCFVNQIPLFIYAPHFILPKKLDANGRTSLDLVPTIMHLMNKNLPNSFLGKSLFEEKFLKFAFAYRNKNHLIYDNKVFCRVGNTSQNISLEVKKEFDIYKKYVETQLYYESIGRIK